MDVVLPVAVENNVSLILGHEAGVLAGPHDGAGRKREGRELKEIIKRG
jgi:hypothetical protein